MNTEVHPSWKLFVTHFDSSARGAAFHMTKCLEALHLEYEPDLSELTKVMAQLAERLVAQNIGARTDLGRFRHDIEQSVEQPAQSILVESFGDLCDMRNTFKEKSSAG